MQVAVRSGNSFISPAVSNMNISLTSYGRNDKQHR